MTCRHQQIIEIAIAAYNIMDSSFLSIQVNFFLSFSRNIQSINKNGGLTAESLPLPRGGNGKVYGVTAVTTCPGGKFLGVDWKRIG